jgi:abhydrolase domain-containing protein 14
MYLISLPQIPTMVVFGTNDNTIGPGSTRDLRELANAELFPMENAGHACYMNQPEQWHYLLVNFILAIEKLEP